MEIDVKEYHPESPRIYLEILEWGLRGLLIATVSAAQTVIITLMLLQWAWKQRHMKGGEKKP